ncbi:MAG TPA: pyridoxal kinase PdxY, partial [Solirubrobacterales bacterium]|nr:pyridoxal kinase PdxY [Solirubrobacterales bacterium]
FSNHTGYGSWKGRVFDGPAIEELVEGIAERGVLDRCDGVLSGYMGSADIGNAILSAVARVRALNPQALYCCDPVIGDVGRGVFVRPGIPEFMRNQAVPAADIITPNQFELDYLSGLATDTLDSVKEAVSAVQLTGPKVVLVTSLESRETPEDCIDLLAAEGGRFWRVRTPKLSINVNGAGDAVSALFFVHYARSRSAASAVGAASASIYGLLKRTAEAGSREILTVEAQDEFVDPTWRFEVEEV